MLSRSRARVAAFSFWIVPPVATPNTLRPSEFRGLRERRAALLRRTRALHARRVAFRAAAERALTASRVQPVDGELFAWGVDCLTVAAGWPATAFAVRTALRTRRAMPADTMNPRVTRRPPLGRRCTPASGCSRCA